MQGFSAPAIKRPAQVLGIMSKFWLETLCLVCFLCSGGGLLSHFSFYANSHDSLLIHLYWRLWNNVCCQRALPPPADQAAWTSPAQGTAPHHHHHYRHYHHHHHQHHDQHHHHHHQHLHPPCLIISCSRPPHRASSSPARSPSRPPCLLPSPSSTRSPPSPPTPPTPTPNSVVACLPPTGRPSFQESLSHLLTQVLFTFAFYKSCATSVIKNYRYSKH